MKRRTFVKGVAAAGSVGVAGCVESGDDENTAEESVRITVVNRLDREFAVDIGILEPDQTFEEGIGWRVTFGLGDDSIEVVEDDLGESEYRIVLQSEGYDDYEHVWNLEECIELSLKVEVREEEFRESARSCRRP